MIQLYDKKLILGSQSPRRQELIHNMGFDFEIRLANIAENYPKHLKAGEITAYLAELKSNAISITNQEILITSDTIVWQNHKSLEKPKNYEQAYQMLNSLSNNWHDVYTSLMLKTLDKTIIKTDIARVKVKALSKAEIDYYISTYKPYDKAGAYAIQEWFGFIAIERIEGSFFTIMGFPTHLFYQMLKEILLP